MSEKNDKLSIYPSRAGRLNIKKRLVASQKGHTMLKKKADALQVKFRKICSNLKDIKKSVQQTLKDANYSYARAKFVGVDFETIILQNAENAQIHLQPIEENIAGVSVLGFQYKHQEDEPFKLVGLSRGGQQIIEVKKKFQELTNLLVDMASLELAHNDLKDNLTSLNRRINSIQYVLLPKLRNTLNYIESELEEVEREEFYRLKKIQKKKKKAWTDFSQTENGMCKRSSCYSMNFFIEKDQDRDILF